MTRRTKPGRITLERLYPLCKYMAAVLISISIHEFPETITLWPGCQAPQAAMMGWVVLLLLAAWWVDHRRDIAEEKDRREVAEKVKNGGLNRSTLLALAVPVLFLLNAAAIIHYFYIYQNSGSPLANQLTLSLDSLAMSVGIILWIYGRELKRIHFGSIWGIKTAVTMKDQATWQRIHQTATLPVCLCGACTLVVSTFFRQPISVVVAVVACVAAFGFMFTRK